MIQIIDKSKLEAAKPGDKFLTRTGSVVTFIKVWIRGHLFFKYQDGGGLVTTAYGHALHLNNDIVKPFEEE